MRPEAPRGRCPIGRCLAAVLAAATLSLAPIVTDPAPAEAATPPSAVRGHGSVTWTDSAVGLQHTLTIDLELSTIDLFGFPLPVAFPVGKIHDEYENGLSDGRVCLIAYVESLEPNGNNQRVKAGCLSFYTNRESTFDPPHGFFFPTVPLTIDEIIWEEAASDDPNPGTIELVGSTAGPFAANIAPVAIT